MYDIGFEFESIVEQWWYNCDDGNKRKVFDFLSLEDIPEQQDNVVQKKNEQSDPGKNNVNLGSMGLKQYEQIVNSDGQNKLLLGGGSNDIEKRVGEDKREEQNLLVRLQLAEGMAIRQVAQLILEEKKRKEMEIIKRGSEREVKR